METAATQRRQNQIGVARVGKADREKRYVHMTEQGYCTNLQLHLFTTVRSIYTSKLLSILQNVDQHF